MPLVNYVVIELTLNILFFHKMKLQKIKQLLFMAQKLEKPRNPYRHIILVTPLDLLYSNCKTWRLPTLFDNKLSGIRSTAQPPKNMKKSLDLSIRTANNEKNENNEKFYAAPVR